MYDFQGEEQVTIGDNLEDDQEIQQEGYDFFNP